jgi:hypothetical protein
MACAAVRCSACAGRISICAPGRSLAVALIVLAVSPDRARRFLQRVRDWLLLRNARLIAAAIMVLLAAALLRNGISGLTHMS